MNISKEAMLGYFSERPTARVIYLESVGLRYLSLILTIIID